MIAAVVLLACAIAAAPPAARAQAADDYAHRIPLEASGDRAFFRVELPAQVYEEIVRADVGDMRVFNATGAPVAHAVLPPPAATREAAGTASLPLFPLRVDAARHDLADVSISMRKSATGTSVDLSMHDGEPVPAQRLVGYLIDATQPRQPLVALTLPFASAANATARVRIDASDDLAGWRTIVADAPLVDLDFAGRRLVRNRVELPRVTAKYLRLTFLARETAPELAGVTAEFGERLAEAPRQWRVAQGSAVPGKPGDFEFDLGGLFPVDRVTLQLAEVNTVAPAQVFARATPADEWRAVASGVFYRLRESGAEVDNPPLAVSLPPRRHWLVRIDPKSGALSAPPRLSAAWHPHVVVFAARGEGPFVLAYGSRRAQPRALTIETLVPGYDRATFDPAALAQARPGAPLLAPASPALREPIDVKRWALWTALIAASVFLGWMALRLSRRLGGRSRR